MILEYVRARRGMRNDVIRFLVSPSPLGYHSPVSVSFRINVRTCVAGVCESN